MCNVSLTYPHDFQKPSQAYLSHISYLHVQGVPIVEKVRILEYAENTD